MKPGELSTAEDCPARLLKQYDLFTCAVEVLNEQRAEFERVLADFVHHFEALACSSNGGAHEKNGSPPHSTDDILQSELSTLRRQLQEKQAEIDELRMSRTPIPEPRAEGGDIEEYEAELNKFRRQLEADRLIFDQELAQLRARNTELDDAAREAELELSRERAQMARERIELERMRAEIRHETEQSQRNNGVRERLAMLQRPKGGNS
jgi:chromosome segregation ATPase